MDRLIYHIDVNSAYLSWEAVERLKKWKEETGSDVLPEDYVDIRTIPCAIGGDLARRRGVILAKSIPAKNFGVRTGESVMEALRKCPSLMLIAPDHKMYARYSRAFTRILEEYTPTLEQFSVDEMFMDMTETIGLFGPPVEVADSIRARIRKELGFTVNVGISSNKLLAKMAGDFEKPDKTHTLFPGEIAEKMWPLPVGELFSVGKATREKLHSLGINTIGDLARYDKNALVYHLKKQGLTIWQYANGLDDSPVEMEDAKGYGNSTTLPYDVSDRKTAHLVLLSLAESVAMRLRKEHVSAGLISTTIKTCKLQSSSHQMVLKTPTNITDELHRAACRLFDELWDGTPIRLLGISTSHISDAAGFRQMSLFDNTDYDRLEKLDAAVDSIRSRFGSDAIKRASLLSEQDIK